MAHDRIIKIDGPLNFRDVADYQNKNGKKVKWNKIYRFDSLSSLSETDREELSRLRVTIDRDLRLQCQKILHETRHSSTFITLTCRFMVYAENPEECTKGHRLFRFLHHIPDLNNNFIGLIY